LKSEIRGGLFATVQEFWGGSLKEKIYGTPRKKKNNNLEEGKGREREVRETRGRTNCGQYKNGIKKKQTKKNAIPRARRRVKRNSTFVDLVNLRETEGGGINVTLQQKRVSYSKGKAKRGGQKTPGGRRENLLLNNWTKKP